MSGEPDPAGSPEAARLREILDALTDPSVPRIPGTERVRIVRASFRADGRARIARAFAGAAAEPAPPAVDLWEELETLVRETGGMDEGVPEEARSLADALEDLEEMDRARSKAAHARGRASRAAGRAATLSLQRRPRGGPATDQAILSQKIFASRNRRRAHNLKESAKSQFAEILASWRHGGVVGEALAALSATPSSDQAWRDALDVMEGRLDDLAREHLLRRAQAVLDGAP